MARSCCDPEFTANNELVCEEIVVRRGERSQVPIIVTMHSSVLEPAEPRPVHGRRGAPHARVAQLAAVGLAVTPTARIVREAIDAVARQALRRDDLKDLASGWTTSASRSSRGSRPGHGPDDLSEPLRPLDAAASTGTCRRTTALVAKDERASLACPPDAGNDSP